MKSKVKVDPLAEKLHCLWQSLYHKIDPDFRKWLYVTAEHPPTIVPEGLQGFITGRKVGGFTISESVELSHQDMLDPKVEDILTQRFIEALQKIWVYQDCGCDRYNRCDEHSGVQESPDARAGEIAITAFEASLFDGSPFTLGSVTTVTADNASVSAGPAADQNWIMPESWIMPTSR